MPVFCLKILALACLAGGVLVAAGAAPGQAAPAVRVQRTAQSVQIATAQFGLTCSLQTGRWRAQWPPQTGGVGRPVFTLQGADGDVVLTGGTTLRVSDYPAHACAAADVTPFKDVLGAGTQIVIHHRAPGKPELRQVIRVSPDRPYFFVRLEVRAAAPVATHDISPLDVGGPAGGVDLGVGDKPRTLFVPYDNDAFVRYNAGDAATSYEVTAVYDATARDGFVVGSVTHDLWKTGIAMSGNAAHLLPVLRVYGGATSKETRDTQPHGDVTGTVIDSPLVLVGFFSDWRDGLEAYGRVNARLSPPLAWTGPAPFGWNSWAAYMTTVSSDDYLAASDFLKTTLEPKDPDSWRGAYVNLDSFWDNFSVEKKIDDVRQIHASGQKAGIYWTPFVYWGDDMARKVEGTDGRYTYAEAVLKDASGKPLPKLDGGYPMDPSHPATLARIDWQCRQFVDWGFDFVKLDFLTHGALEGAHFDPNVTTGTAAYNLGMARLDADLAPARVGRPFFISLSIAPLFPAGYGHSRRISCDTFGTIGNSAYMLNSLTYGWWEGGTVYAFNDGDAALMYQAHGQPVTTPEEGRTRLDANIAAGSLILDGDDLRSEPARARIAPLLTNPKVNALARQGKPFRPVEGDTGSDASDVFSRPDASPGAFDIAVFNYSTNAAATKHLSLGRLGLDPSATYQVLDLWTHQTYPAQGTLTVDLPPGASTLLRLSR